MINSVMLPQIFESDNLDVMSRLRPESIHLCYMDPPFATGKRQSGKAGSFDDPGNFEAHLERLRLRCEEARRLLTRDGCLVVHVDPKTSHYVKVMLDGVFGRECFASEIVWRYRRWSSKTTNFQRVHDVLLRYVRDTSVKPRFNQLFEPLAASTVATWGACKQAAVFAPDGRRSRSSVTGSDSPGAPMGDVWDISIVAPVAHERTGYPTQKPEALLERLILSTTNPGDTVLDPYLGSGTTLAVAMRLGRNSVGIDQNPDAIAVARKRMRMETAA